MKIIKKRSLVRSILFRGVTLEITQRPSEDAKNLVFKAGKKNFSEK